MASTIDFSSYNDADLLYGYQRVNRAKFPHNFFACADEIARRGLSLPHRFEFELSPSEFESSLPGKLGRQLVESLVSFTRALPTLKAWRPTLRSRA